MSSKTGYVDERDLKCEERRKKVNQKYPEFPPNKCIVSGYHVCRYCRKKKQRKEGEKQT